MPGPLAGLRVLDIATIVAAPSAAALLADYGSVRMQNVVPRFVGDPARIRSTGGAPGEHNDEVWGGWLGFTAAERQRLRDSGVVWRGRR